MNSRSIDTGGTKKDEARRAHLGVATLPHRFAYESWEWYG
jgi:hypothetical protein